MIKMIRLDDRLIHGQVAVKWAKHLNVDRIIVASDEAAGNQLQANALKMAAPSGVKVFVLPIDKAVSLCNDERSASMRILIVTDSVEKIHAFSKDLNEKAYIDLANYGRLTDKSVEREKVFDTLYLSQDEIGLLKELKDNGFEVAYQPLPEDTKIDLLSKL